MPNWKKVITSGSNAHLNHITASGAILAKNFQVSNGDNYYISTSLAEIDGFEVDPSSPNNIAYKLGSSYHGGFFSLYASGTQKISIHSTTDSYINTNFNFGIGTSSPDSKLEVDGDITATHITASGNISASGTISADAITTGNPVFHNGLFNTGPTNPKLKISSSNDIVIESSDDIFFKSDGTTIAQIFGGEAILDLNGTLDVSSHITASGDISSSGTITGNSIVGTLTGTATGLAGTPDITVDDIDAKGIELEGSTSSTKLTINNTGISSIDTLISLQKSGATNWVLGADGGDNHFKINASSILSAAPDFKLDSSGNGSFAGNVSSSGTMTMLTASIGGGIFTSASLAAGGSGGAVSAVANGSDNRLATFSSANALNGEANLTFDGSTLEVVGNISASGNTQVNQITASAFQFSGSGTAQLDVQGDITASGDISASGTLTANGGTFTGAVSFGDNNITNVGDIDCDTISIDSISAGLTIDVSSANTGLAKILMRDNVASGFNIAQGTIAAGAGADVSYLKFDTTDSAEKVIVGKKLEVNSDISSSGEIRGASLKVGTKSVTVEANSIINQDLSTDGDAQFNSLVLGGSTPIAFIGGANYSIGGDAPIDFDLVDDNASALSFDASGKAGMLEFVTTNGSEKVKVSSEFIVAGTMSGSTAITDNLTTDVLTSNDITASNSILLPHEKTITFANDGNSIASSGELASKSIIITAEDNITMVPGTSAGNRVDINGNLDASGYALFTGAVTASGNISSSGTLFISASEGGSTQHQILVFDSGSGEVFYTGSSAVGGGGGSFSFTGNQFATDLKVGRDSDNHIDFTTDNQIDFDVDGETAFTIKNTSDSGSIAVSGSVKIQPQEAIPAVSESRLYNKTTANGNVVDDLQFGTAALTPAYAWVSLDDDGTLGTSELIFGKDSAVTSTAYNMTVVHDTSTNGTRIYAQLDGVYKVQQLATIQGGSGTTTFKLKVDGSDVHTKDFYVHGAVDPVDRSHIYVGSISSGSYVSATLTGDGVDNTSYEDGSILMVERLS